MTRIAPTLEDHHVRVMLQRLTHAWLRAGAPMPVHDEPMSRGPWAYAWETTYFWPHPVSDLLSWYVRDALRYPVHLEPWQAQLATRLMGLTEPLHLSTRR